MAGKGSGFWNWMAPRYARARIRDEASYQRKLDETRAVLNDGMRVLEIGCGTGTTAVAHAPFVRSILGIDYSDKMVEIARGRAADAGVENARFEVGSIGALNAGPASYEAVLAMNILHLLPDYAQAIETAYKVLPPGGYFISSTACIGRGFMPIKILLTVLSPLGILPKVQYLSQDELLGEMRRTGFEVITSWKPPSRMAATFVIARRPSAAY